MMLITLLSAVKHKKKRMVQHDDIINRAVAMENSDAHILVTVRLTDNQLTSHLDSIPVSLIQTCIERCPQRKKGTDSEKCQLPCFRSFRGN